MIVSLKSSNESAYWWLVTLCILAIALAARFVASTADTFCWDCYAMMGGVEGTFSEYSERMGSYGLNSVVHYWLSYRIFGSTLSGYMVLPLISSLATLLVVYWGLRRYWHSTPGICFFVLLILVFNVHSLYLASYSIWTYANSLLISVSLYFLFVRLSMGSLTRRQWLWIAAFIIPAAFFSTSTVVVPVATGIFSVVFVRWWHSSPRCNLKRAWQFLTEMWPLALFPLTYLLVQLLHPFENWGVEKRPDMAGFYFHSSQYAHDFWGAIQFVLNNTVSLFRTLMAPYPIPGIGATKPILIVVGTTAAVSMMMLFIRLIRRRTDPKETFTLVFIVVTFSAITVGGLAGLYPFGKARYAGYLLIPVAISIGYVASLVLEWISLRTRMARNSKVLPLMLAVILLVSGAYLNLKEYNSNSAVSTRNAAALEEIKNSNAELILFSSYSAPVLAARTEDLYSRAQSMGWGTFYGHGSDGGVPNMIVEAVTEGDESGPVKSILVIAPSAALFTSLYPSWSDFLATHFDQDMSIDAPSIWGGYFRGK